MKNFLPFYFLYLSLFFSPIFLFAQDSTRQISSAPIHPGVMKTMPESTVTEQFDRVQKIMEERMKNLPDFNTPDEDKRKKTENNNNAVKPKQEK